MVTYNYSVGHLSQSPVYLRKVQPLHLVLILYVPLIILRRQIIWFLFIFFLDVGCLQELKKEFTEFFVFLG